MKKSLILSVVMTLVLVLSLSTATYAWYTSNLTVTTQATTVGTATAGSANLVFEWKNGDNVVTTGLTEVAFDSIASGATGLSPMVPQLDAAPVVGTTTSLSFISSLMNAEGSNFTAAAASATPWTQQYTGSGSSVSYTLTTVAPDDWATQYTNYYQRSGTEGSYVYSRLTYSATGAPNWAANTFCSANYTDDYKVPDGVTAKDLYIKNNSQLPTGNITVSCDFTSGTEAKNVSAKNAMRVAIFFKGTYVCTFATTAAGVNYSSGWEADAVINTVVQNTGYTSVVAAQTLPATDNACLGAAGSAQIEIYAWYDGKLLTNDNAGGSANFALTFTAA